MVNLDGSGSSDADNDPLTYSWSLLSKPDKSAAVLYNTNLAQISFVADVAGTFKVRLIVSDGKSYSNPADVTITAGTNMVDVPNLSGKTQQNAELAIIAAGLRLGAVTLSSSDTVTSGSVISQKPATPAVLPKGSTVDMTVSSGPVTDTEAPVLDVRFDRTPAVYDIGENVYVTIIATDNSGTPNITATVDGTSKAVTLPDTIISTATFTAGTNHSVVITATDSSSNRTTKTLVFGITDATKTTPPDLNIITPVADAEITAPTAIVGTVTTPNLLQYTLSYAAVGTSSFTQFASGTSPITNGTLGTIDPTLLKNGIYDIRLTAMDTNGKSTDVDVTYRVKGDMKVGNFTVTFTDLMVPVTGIPITVNRTYDSREKSSKDFGIGWSVDIQNVKTDENRTPGEGWPQAKGGGVFGQYCITGDTEHYVSVALPDGRTEEFDVTLTPNCQRLSPVEQTSISYTARPGTTSALALKTSKLLLVAGGQLIDPDTGGPFDPSGYSLTTADGMVYDLDQSYGVKSVTDPNGNKLTYDQNGITHSAGKGVTFTRDSKNRITKITAPDNSTITYAYDADGNLASMTDQAGNVTTYSYNSSHGLTDIKDPRGITPVKNEYDASGRLVAHTDAYGKRIEYTHDIAGRQEVVKDRNGNLTVYIYDENGRVFQKTDPIGNVTTYIYDSVGDKLSETDALGNTTSWIYDSKKNVLSETKTVNGQAVTKNYTYSNLSRVLTTADPLGNVTTNGYDSKGNLIAVTDPLGNTTTNEYNSSGNIISTADPLGRITAYEYDTYGHRTKQTDPLGNVSTFTYDTNGRKTSETNPNGGTTLYTYDPKGRITSVQDPLGNISRTEYDAAGNKIAEINSLGLRTIYYYDSANRLVEAEQPDGTTTKTAYDPEGNAITKVDQEGRITQNVYDGKKQLTQITFPDGTTRSYSYDAAGRQMTATDPDGSSTISVFDSRGKETQHTDPTGSITSFEYDLAGNQIQQIDGAGQVALFQYDVKNQVTSITLPGGQSSQVTYDYRGQKASETDAAENTTRFDYDANGRLIKVTDAAGGVTKYDYDPNGNRTAIIDARGNRTTFIYDNANRLISKTMPNGGTETYSYDSSGKVVAKTDALGRTIEYSYDTNGRLTTKIYPDKSTVSLAYTPTNKRASVSDGRGTASYSYDNKNRLAKVTYPDSKTISYTYDPADRISTLSSMTGTISYVYNPGGRLKEVKDPSGMTTSISYDQTGNRIGLLYPNGTSVSYSYDTNNRLEQVTHRDAISQVLASYSYTLGPTGSRTRIDEANGIVRQYTYDNLNRVTNEQVTDPLINQTYQNTFNYDVVGNRLGMTHAAPSVPDVSVDFAYNNADQLVTENGATYAYDLNGNLASNGTTTYTYNFDNRLIKVSTAAETVTYSYDAFGNRVEMRDASGTFRYLVDTNRSLPQVLAEYTPAATIIASYVYADDLISMNSHGQTYYYHFDGLGSARLLSDSAGLVSDTYDYDAFGNMIAHTGTTENPFLFTGQQYDANTMFYYLRARYYQPETGRFISFDPYAGDPYTPVSLHKYLYAADDPANKVDPSGLDFDMGSVLSGIVIGSVIAGIAAMVWSVLGDSPRNDPDEGQGKVCCQLVDFPFVAKILRPRHCYIVVRHHSEIRTFGLYPDTDYGYFNGIGIPTPDNKSKDKAGICQSCNKRSDISGSLYDAFNTTSEGYPRGRYNWLGPNSNTYAAYMATSCCSGGFPGGLGWTPGSDATPPWPQVSSYLDIYGLMGGF